MDNTTNEMIEESSIINEEHPAITLSDKSVVDIHKAKVKQIGEVMRFIAYLMKKIGMKKLTDKPSIDLENPAEVMLLIADSADKIYPMAACLCSLSVEEFEDLEIDDAMNILLAEWDLNKSFFLQKVVPMLARVQPAPKSPTSKVSRKKRSTPKRKAT